jgi:hypothetical protein
MPINLFISISTIVIEELPSLALHRTLLSYSPMEKVCSTRCSERRQHEAPGVHVSWYLLSKLSMVVQRNLHKKRFSPTLHRGKFILTILNDELNKRCHPWILVYTRQLTPYSLYQNDYDPTAVAIQRGN